MQSGQRGWKRQPAGGSARSGGAPGMPTRRCIGPVSGGNDSISPRVYGCRGDACSCALGAVSTISPAYMIAIRSANSISSERSCVMKRTAKPRSRFRSWTCCRISRCTTTSSAVVGSSMIKSSGPSASAIAMITRCRMPPESSCGNARRRLRSMPTTSSSSPARASDARLRDALVRAHHVDELVADAHHRVERVHRALEDHRDVRQRKRRSCSALQLHEILALEEDAAARDVRRRAQDLHDRVRDRASCRSPTRPRARRPRRRGSSGRCRRPPARGARRRRSRPSRPRSSTSASPSRRLRRSRRHRLDHADHVTLLQEESPPAHALDAQARVADLVDAGEHERQAEHGDPDRKARGRRTTTTRPAARSS